MTKFIIIIAIIILLIILAAKLSGKIIKAVICAIFIAFVIYIITGTDIISEFLDYIGKSSFTETIQILKIR